MAGPLKPQNKPDNFTLQNLHEHAVPVTRPVSFGQGKTSQTQSRSFSDKAWLSFKEAAWKSYRLVEEAINSLVNEGCRIALMSTFILPMPQPVYDFIERQTFYAPVKSCSLELLDNEELADQIIEYKIPMKNGAGKRINIAAWHIPAPEGSDKPTILFSHGRHSNISHLQHYLKAFSDTGYGILAYDYPGFGNSTGKVTLENCYKSSLEVSKHLSNRLKVPLKEQVLVGYSLGTHITSHLAAVISKNTNNEFKGEKPKAVVLLNSFPKLSDCVTYQRSKLAKQKLWFLNENWALQGLNYCFNTRNMRADLDTQSNLEKAKDLKTLIISATNDEELNYRDAETMAQKLNAKLKEKEGHPKIIFEKMEGVGHSLKEKDCEKFVRLLTRLIA
jgi:acetyl esterase/lipase